MSKWTKVKLGNVCLIAKGEQLNKLDLEKAGEYPCINGGISPSGFTDNWNTEANTITISEGGNSCGFVSFQTKRFWSGGHCYSLLELKGNIYKGFLFQALKGNESAIMSLRVGSGLPNIQQKAIRDFELIIPDALPEQRQIATILSTADAVIEKTQAAIAKYKAIKQGMLQDLFTRGIDTTTGKLRLRYQDAPELYKESKLGWIPGEWEVVTIENIAKVHGRVGWKGYTVSDLRETGPLALGATHIDKENKLDLAKPVHLSMDKFIESPEIMVYFGDILIVQRGTIGKIVIIDREIGDATINPSMVILNTIKINSFFLYFQLCSFIGQRQIELLTSQTGVPMISQKQINSIKITIPKNDNETNSIAIRIQSIDKIIFNEEELLSKQKQIKAGLMSDLLSGKKQVTIKENQMA